MKKSERLDRYRYTMGLNAWEVSSYLDRDSRRIVMNDGPCGVRKPSGQDFGWQTDIMVSVCMPNPSALAASFDEELTYLNGTFLAADCISKGVDILLAPGINIKRHALCGRNFEYFSEDPYLAGILAAAYVRGLEDNGIGACVKHYCCNNQEYYRQTVSSELSLRALNEIYLRPFELVCKLSEPTAVMTSYNKVNDIYPSESHYLLGKKLRGEFGFKGMVMSDWCALRDKGKSVECGINLEMPLSGRTPEYMERLYEKGEINLDELKKRDEEFAVAVKKFYSPKQSKPYDMDEVHEEAVKIAQSTMTLIKNDNKYLPLNHDDKLLVIGYFAKNPRLVGLGSGWVNAYKKESFLEVLDGVGADYDYIEGFNESGLSVTRDALLSHKGKGAKVLLFLGQFDGEDSESRDRKEIELICGQNELATLVKDVFGDFATVLTVGSVVNVENVYNCSSAMLITYLAGEGQSKAIYNNIFGLNNPSGRLPETWISSLKQNPLYGEYKKYNPFYTYYDEDVYVGYRYYDLNKTHGFMLPFGYGMSYSEFEYSDFNVGISDEKIVCSLTVKNKSQTDGSDVIQIYSSLPNSNIYRPVKELKGFKKVFVKTGESKTVQVIIEKSALESYNVERDAMLVEEGNYIFHFAKNTADIFYSSEPTFVSGEKFAIHNNPDKLMRKQPDKKFKYETPVGCAVAVPEFSKYLRSTGISDGQFNRIMSCKAVPLSEITYMCPDKIDFFALDELIEILNGTSYKDDVPTYKTNN